ncbi:hypothetical protein ABIF29_003161 [Bradyrhizobium elkanii]|uniref:Uncharacterized protein n=1 Tax=Bradyrhizobium elkanii TaxID=29448 RepID=A0ABV4EYV3_BRAEL
MTQAAPQPDAETTAPTAIGPVTWPKLLPVINRPIITGTIAADRAAAGAVASNVAGIRPPIAENSRHSQNAPHPPSTGRKIPSADAPIANAATAISRLRLTPRASR